MLCRSLKSGKEMQVPEKTVLCLGNFDGVHAGHRALLSCATEEKERLGEGVLCGVLTFTEPSGDYLLPTPPGHLSTKEEQETLFAECGMDFVISLDFPSVRDLSPKAFISEILQKQANCVCAVCGYNYRFGKGGVGTPEVLSECFSGKVAVVPPVLFDGGEVSSTRIRLALAEGNVALAEKLLGHPYAITAPVLHGKALGKLQGVPTVNQNFPAGKQEIARGVYATVCEIDGKKYPAVSNVGVRPTVEDGAFVNCESYLLDFDGDLYGKIVTTSFLFYLRPEKKFPDRESLYRQIEEDIKKRKSL